MTQDSNKNYVAAWIDYKTDKVVVLERDQEGTLFQKKYHPPYYFYVKDEENGTYTSIFGDKLIRAEFGTSWEYKAAIEQMKREGFHLFESDISPLKRILMDTYYGRPAPPVHFAFFDIEVDYAQKIGFAGPTNPYAPINAVTVYQSWTKKYITVAIPPLVDGVRWDLIPGNNVDALKAEITSLIEKKQLRAGIMPEIVLVKDELELLELFLDAIQDADIISGWHSEFFDIPYTAERLLLAGGETLLARLEHAGVRPPRREMVNRFGTEEPIYKFTGRSHLDYMRLFQKFTFEGRTSYALGNILQEEVGVGKLEFDGTLEQLYKTQFAKFVAYNFRDTDGLVQLDDKFKFIALANQMAHENTVPFEAVLGTVAYVETGITNHAHYVLNKIVHDKRIVPDALDENGNKKKVEGAVVLTPHPGLYEWVFSVDINSLYPNVCRTLNISPEKVIGQMATPDAWGDIYKDSSTRHTLQLDTGEQIVASGKELKTLFKEKKWAISGYGTVFDQSSGVGVVPSIIGAWYDERKKLQAEKKRYAKMLKSAQAQNIDIPEEWIKEYGQNILNQ